MSAHTLPFELFVALGLGQARTDDQLLGHGGIVWHHELATARLRECFLDDSRHMHQIARLFCVEVMFPQTRICVIMTDQPSQNTSLAPCQEVFRAAPLNDRTLNVV